MIKLFQSNLEWKDPNGNLLYSWPAISGPYGNGRLPCGNWNVQSIEEVTEKIESWRSYCDNQDNCWRAYIEPQFSTSRSGFFIHPDGGQEGTKGCIGITPSINTRTIWDDLKEFLTRYNLMHLKVESDN